jgi:hypothetical protein
MFVLRIYAIYILLALFFVIFLGYFLVSSVEPIASFQIFPSAMFTVPNRPTERVGFSLHLPVLWA